MNWFKKNKKPELSVGDLTYAFTDDDGNKYYGFPSSVAFPLERHAKRSDIIMWMSAGLTSDELHKLLDVAEAAFEEFASGTKGSLAIAGAALKQIRMRADLVIHHSLLYQWIAVHYVRKDESLFTINNAVMDEKIASFEKMVAGGRLLDFFHLPELMNICNTIGMSSSEYQQSWNDSETELITLNRKLKYLTSELKSHKKEKISTIA